MNFLKRAWLATKAKKGRSILLTLVTTAILIFVLAGITIKNASSVAVENAKKETGSTISLQLNRDYMMSQMKPPSSSGSSIINSKIIPIPTSVAKKLAKNSVVSSYLFSTTTTANASKGVEAISTSANNNTSTSDSKGPQMESGDFTITGVSDTEKVSEFKSSTNKISKGTGITSDTANNYAIISSDLADSNKLEVGGKFSITKTVNNKTVTQELTIIGIYESSSSVNSAQLQNSSSNPQNNIYTNIATVNSLKGSTDTIDSATYTVSNPDKLNSLLKNMKKEINSKKYSLVSSEEMYKQMLQPLNNISSIAQNIILLVSIAGAIILTLIVMLSIRERRFEIGVLMSLGENRFKIIAQFFTELLIVTLVSLSLASLAGNYVGNVLGNQLISKNTTQQTQPIGSNSRQGNVPPGQGTPPGHGIKSGSMGSTANPKGVTKDLDITMGAQDVVKLGGMSLIISFISICLASIGILKQKPKDILTSN